MSSEWVLASPECESWVSPDPVLNMSPEPVLNQSWMWVLSESWSSPEYESWTSPESVLNVSPEWVLSQFWASPEYESWVSPDQVLIKSWIQVLSQSWVWVLSQSWSSPEYQSWWVVLGTVSSPQEYDTPGLNIWLVLQPKLSPGSPQEWPEFLRNPRGMIKTSNVLLVADWGPGTPRIPRWKCPHRIHPPLKGGPRCAYPLHKEERQPASLVCRLPRPKPLNEEGSLSPPAHLQPPRCTQCQREIIFHLGFTGSVFVWAIPVVRWVTQ